MTNPIFSSSKRNSVDYNNLSDVKLHDGDDGQGFHTQRKQVIKVPMMMAQTSWSFKHNPVQVKTVNLK